MIITAVKRPTTHSLIFFDGTKESGEEIIRTIGTNPYYGVFLIHPNEDETEQDYKLEPYCPDDCRLIYPWIYKNTYIDINTREYYSPEQFNVVFESSSESCNENE